MVFKIKTSKRTMEIFEEISASENLAPFILSKLAIAMSIKSEETLKDEDLNTDVLGLELNRQTITAEYDDLFKSLIEMSEGRHISDEEYFPTLIKAHLDRGARIIYSEFKYNKDFLLALLSEEKGI